MEATTAHFRRISIPQRVYVPERRVYRVGERYVYRDIQESLASAVAAFLTAHYRLANGRVAKFDWYWLASRLSGYRTQWETCLRYLVEVGVPLSGNPPLTEPFVPRSVFVAGTADEIVAAVLEHGPVLMYLPWPPLYDHTSKAYGVDWVGPDGTDLMGPGVDRLGLFRGVLVKGVAAKYRAVCLHDDREGLDQGPRWFPISELNRVMSNGGHALSAIF